MSGIISSMLLACYSFAAPLSATKTPTCMPPKIRVGAGVEAWGTEADRKLLQRAKKKCIILFPDSPCVKEIRKVGENSYNVICGREQ